MNIFDIKYADKIVRIFKNYPFQKQVHFMKCLPQIKPQLHCAAITCTAIEHIHNGDCTPFRVTNGHEEQWTHLSFDGL
jgi:hypothetical protein